MALYEVKFFIRTKEELSTGEIANVAHTVWDRMNQRGTVPKPEDRKVYVRREYEEHEKTDLLKKHVNADIAAGRDWNDPRLGCTCEICLKYRHDGARVTPESIELPPVGGRRPLAGGAR